MPEPKKLSSPALVIRKMIAAPREKVFAAWLDPESMKYWMCPGHIVSAEAEIDPRVGGKYRILMKGENEDYDHTGEYLVLEAPSKLVFTWISKETDRQPTRVTVELFDRGGKCELVLTHEGIPRAEAVEGHKRGWSELIGKLANYLEKAQ